ncbi:phosphatidylinositol transfer protein PDR17 [Hordeum vulgare]|nr:phosphatidylinositol transfer protein PDR17 [Hordeum vulgare]
MFRRKQASHFNSDDSEQRQAKINKLRAALGPMSANGKKYCSEACLARYLEARNRNVDKSRKMLEESLKWRAVSRPEDIHWPDVSVEAETGKMYRATFADREGRAVVIMIPAKQVLLSHGRGQRVATDGGTMDGDAMDNRRSAGGNGREEAVAMD